VHVAETHVDGQRFVAEFLLDELEHERRVCCGAISFTDRRVLHALWSLPTGGRVHVDSLAPHDVETLREHGPGAVEFIDDQVSRVFQPAVSVRAIASIGHSLRALLNNVARVPPVYERVALALARSRPSVELIEEATRRGVGLASHVDGETRWWCTPPPAVVGVPAVYRWWISELVYDQWRQAKYEAH
jgi:hypothetical protein